MTWMARAISTCGCGKPDLLAGNSWFKYRGGNRFDPIRVGSIGGRIRAGRFVRTSRTAQIVIAPGDGSGPLRFYECKGDPGKSESWVGHNLLDRDMIHGHTLDIGDVDGDGNLDIFAADMAKWTTKPGVDHLAATAWILYGDGDLDILNKQYSWNAPRVGVWLNNGTKH